jgi:predicted RNA-binding Zn-ribbon protein involved in translation (DUF1610 family)
MVIIYGKKVRHIGMGATAQVCPMCAELIIADVMAMQTQSHVYYIPTSGFTTQLTYRQCRLCRGRCEHPAESDCSASWPAETLAPDQQMLQATQPALLGNLPPAPPLKGTLPNIVSRRQWALLSNLSDLIAAHKSLTPLLGMIQLLILFGGIGVVFGSIFAFSESKGPSQWTNLLMVLLPGLLVIGLLVMANFVLEKRRNWAVVQPVLQRYQNYTGEKLPVLVDAALALGEPHRKMYRLLSYGRQA